MLDQHGTPLGKWDHLTGTEVNKAHDAAEYLMEHKDALRIDAVTASKISTLWSDLTAEQEDRRQIAKH
jgi:hypothetical protein